MWWNYDSFNRRNLSKKLPGFCGNFPLKSKNNEKNKKKFTKKITKKLQNLKIVITLKLLGFRGK